MCGSKKCCQRGVKLWQRFFLNWWGEAGSKYHYKWAIIGPPAKRHWIECWLGSLVICRGPRPILPGTHIFLWFFSWRGSGLPAPPPFLDPRMLCMGETPKGELLQTMMTQMKFSLLYQTWTKITLVYNRLIIEETQSWVIPMKTCVCILSSVSSSGCLIKKN